MTRKIPKWAAKVAAQITQNCADVSAERITWGEFTVRQRAAWDLVARGELNVIGSACHRRHMLVQAAMS